MRLALSLSDVQAVKEREELKLALCNICTRYDLSHVSFLVVRNGVNATHYPFYCTTYPAAWIEAYLTRNLFEIDPVMDIVRAGHLPVDWSSLDQKSTQVRHFFEEARSHGVGPNGLTIPVRGAHGERALFSVASDLSTQDWSSLCASSTHDLHILSHYLHETVLAVTGLRKDARYKKLSRRERQCLQLLAAGKIHKQIAAALEISESSVRLYLRSARNKLGASTSHHAVARASFLELINL
jgi:DNA-binding CsgD family transcriptional regulator